MNNILLIDGKNTAYRALFGNRGRNHPFVGWLHTVCAWIDKFKPTEIHVFWDCPRTKVWRRHILAEYKESRSGSHVDAEDIREALGKLISVARVILPHLGVRQYYVDGQECDDLIYAACKAMVPSVWGQHELIIVSKDSDYLQIPWVMPFVKCYDPINNEFMERPDVDPVVQKALSGDKSDNIDGYVGIGPVKSKRIASTNANLLEFLESCEDRSLFKRNLALIDMSLNPKLISNYIYVRNIMNTEVNLDTKMIKELVMKYKVNGFFGDMTRFTSAFRTLIPKIDN